MPGGEPLDRAGVVRIITEGIIEGQSQNATMRFAREQGLRFGNEKFRELWNAQAKAVANRERIAGLYPDLPVPDGLHTTLSGKGQDGWSYTTRMLVGRSGEAGVETLSWLVTSDHPMTPAEVAAEVADAFDAGLVTGSDTFDQLHAVTVIGAYKLEV